MVRCSDAEFVAFQKRKSSKKVPREAGAAFGVGITLEGEAPSAAPITEAAGAEVEAYVNLPEVPREIDVERKPVQVSEAAEVADRAEAPVGENSPIWTVKESQSVADRYLIEHYFYYINETIRSLLVPITWFNGIFIKYDLILIFSKFYT